MDPYSEDTRIHVDREAGEEDEDSIDHVTSRPRRSHPGQHGSSSTHRWPRASGGGRTNEIAAAVGWVDGG